MITHYESEMFSFYNYELKISLLKDDIERSHHIAQTKNKHKVRTLTNWNTRQSTKMRVDYQRHQSR